jgi:hypothetical protein
MGCRRCGIGYSPKAGQRVCETHRARSRIVFRTQRTHAEPVPPVAVMGCRRSDCILPKSVHHHSSMVYSPNQNATKYFHWKHKSRRGGSRRCSKRHPTAWVPEHCTRVYNGLNTTSTSNVLGTSSMY